MAATKNTDGPFEGEGVGEVDEGAIVGTTDGPADKVYVGLSDRPPYGEYGMWVPISVLDGVQVGPNNNR